jgi:hypothetical protein
VQKLILHYFDSKGAVISFINDLKPFKNKTIENVRALLQKYVKPNFLKLQQIIIKTSAK